MNIFYSVIKPLSLGLVFFAVSASTLNPNEIPMVQFNREVIADMEMGQTSLYEEMHLPIPSPFTQKSIFQRLLYQSQSSISDKLLSSERTKSKYFNLEKFSKRICQGLNISLKKPFSRGIYIICEGQIIGYGLIDPLYLYIQKNPPVVDLISALPINENLFKKYLPQIKFGKIELREVKRNGYIEQYALYHDPDGGKILFLDAFYPEIYANRLEKPLGKALYRFIGGYETMYQNNLMNQQIPEEENDVDDFDMD